MNEAEFTKRDAIRVALTSALDALRAREWVVIPNKFEYFCPECHNLIKHGHDAACSLGLAIAKLDDAITQIDTL